MRAVIDRTADRKGLTGINYDLRHIATEREVAGRGDIRRGLQGDIIEGRGAGLSTERSVGVNLHRAATGKNGTAQEGVRIKRVVEDEDARNIGVKFARSGNQRTARIGEGEGITRSDRESAGRITEDEVLSGIRKRGRGLERRGVDRDTAGAERRERRDPDGAATGEDRAADEVVGRDGVVEDEHPCPAGIEVTRAGDFTRNRERLAAVDRYRGSDVTDGQQAGIGEGA